MPSYRTVWRWHFYAGVFAIPFVILLASTGSIYLFRPQIEAWIDRPYDGLADAGAPAPPSRQVEAALAAVPGSMLRAYELPKTPTSAARVIVAKGGEATRVYVHPATLRVLHEVREEDRFMRVLFRLHGELLLGNRGSNLVEIAASWTIVLLLTGLFLWWPREGQGLAGVAYPRLGAGGRVFWRDVHAVTGVWISSLALFLLLTGLPWAKFWGEYFKAARRVTGTAAAQQDWTTGRPPRAESDEGEHAGHSGMSKGSGPARPQDLSGLDRVVAAVRPLGLAPPVLVSPPSRREKNWTAKSDAANRPLRVNLVLDGATGAVLAREDFKDRHVLDRIVGTGIAAHEGQLFGWPNQVLGLLTALGLVTLSVSALVLWWRRRAAGVLGAPEPAAQGPASIGLGLAVLLLALYLPLFGATLLAVRLLEGLVLRRIPAVRTWLGLAAPGGAVT